MIVIPAIDLKSGECVRLYKGDYGTSRKVAEDPLRTALSFKNAGAERIHTVDLDGAKAGVPVNDKIILDIARKTGITIDAGGGIRDMKTIEHYLKNGASKVILGSAAVKNQQLVTEAVKEFGDKISVGIDAQNGLVKAEGWIVGSDINYIELAKRMEDKGVSEIIFTDIDRDGTLEGVNSEQLSELSLAVSCNIIASGGVSSIDDIKALLDLNIYGVICGKALYSGKLDLKQAVSLCRGVTG